MTDNQQHCILEEEHRFPKAVLSEAQSCLTAARIATKNNRLGPCKRETVVFVPYLRRNNR
ncbi:hypothetical protein [Schleiferilactobacillus harbinensis]|uniref:hypothetical protein n=1 Tax=Schleiferilactobacillus harbinensis TaxID=304207 RepID=UPI0039E86263